jgi:hypothetical protein
MPPSKRPVRISRRLRELLSRLAVLERHFPPKDGEFSLSGHYTREQDDKTKAYLLLVHAELESYFEERAKSRADIAHSHWQRTGKCPLVLSRLLVYHQEELEALSPAAVTKAMNYYLDKIEKNHGIKEKNLLSLFLPVGLGHRDLDTRLVAACDQLARKRGQFAHASFKAHQQVDPQTERDNVRENIMPELIKLDRKIRKLR